jgi:hypothetical protein
VEVTQYQQIAASSLAGLDIPHREIPHREIPHREIPHHNHWARLLIECVIWRDFVGVTLLV